jgi:CubicO group peptidase (beta-lactamase class C family)
MTLRHASTLALLLALLAPLGAAATTTARHIANIESDIHPLVPAGAPPVSLAQDMAAHHVPSVSVAVVDHGRIVWTRAYGLADVASNTRATPRTLYLAGSVSKPVAASGALKLVEAGKLSLDGDVNGELKSWRLPDSPAIAGHKITLRLILTHTGGLSVHGFGGYAAGARVPSVVQVLNGAPPANSAPVVVDQTPGTAWRYSGGGITIAQLMMSEAAGETFPVLMRRLVLEPVGMGDSTYEQPLPQARAAQAATGYLVRGDPVAGRFHTYPEMAAAGLWTTPSDLAKWAIALQRAYAGERSPLMTQASARAMLTPGLGDWGLGIQVQGQGETLRFSHGGDDWGYKAQLVGWLSGGRAIVVMANGDGAIAVEEALLRAIAREYGWNGLEPRPGA